MEPWPGKTVTPELEVGAVPLPVPVSKFTANPVQTGKQELAAVGVNCAPAAIAPPGVQVQPSKNFPAGGVMPVPSGIVITPLMFA
jgi:hypothetical protein